MQLNQINQWLDLSQVYNAVRGFMLRINRDANSTKGFLRSSPGNHLPRCLITPSGRAVTI